MPDKDRVNVLLVDDQPAKLLSLQTILEPLDENVASMGSADEALRYLLSHDCAVVLVDVCMPRMDGFEFAELIRVHPRFCRTAVIFISGVFLSDADRLRGYNLGAVDYIPVPIVPDVLRAKVAIFVELFRKNRELERLNAELRERIAEINVTTERLRVADRMATIGTLAAGLGHDMGNLLLPVRMRLDALDDLGLPPAGAADLRAIREASEYLQALAKSLRLLALDPETDKADGPPASLAEWWAETGAMMRSAVPRNVALHADIDPALPHVRISKAALTQVAFNLVQNAGDAMRDRPGARIELSAARSADQASVVLSVADNGPGMSEETLRRCFEPFFTTKTRGVSTGLGLALVDGLVKRAGGTARVESIPGRGARVSVELPAQPPPASAPAGAPRPLAGVSVRDRRLYAHVKSILAACEHDVADGAHPDADVWITDAEPDEHPQAPRPRTVVLRAGPPDRPLDGAEYVELNQRTSALREQLRRIIESWGPQGAGRP